MKIAWPSVALSEIVMPQPRPEAVEADKQYRLLGVRLDGQGPFLRETVMGSSSSATRLFRVKAGDFIYSRLFACRGAFGIIPPDLDGCYVSGEFPIFATRTDQLELNFLNFWFQLPSTQRKVDEDCTGSTPLTRNRFKENFFLALNIPLPPVVEQQRIVARIEAVAAQVREAQRLRHDATTEAALLFYASMKTMRLRLLGSGMQISPLGSLTKVTAGGTPSRDNPEYWGGTIPWVKTGELLDGELDFAEEYITELGVQNSSAKVFPIDTILLALYGQGQTRGRTGRLLMPAATNQACCAILPSPERFRPRFMQYWLRSLYYDLREDAQGGAQPNWNGGMIKSLPIARPTLHEQDRIIDELDCLQTPVESLKRTQIATATELDALLPAILDKAFRGELV